jgi:putative transferase (TIGR04331 family)
MSNKQQTRHLVTTADERTWPSGRPLLFLGGWCQPWKGKHQWQSLDAMVAEPYGLGQQLKDENHAYVRNLELSLFPELCDLLGDWHGVCCDQRYWKIILGHWFRRYIEVIFNRARTLQSCIAKYPIDSTSILINPRYSLAVYDSNSAIWASNDDRWNHELYVRLMKMMPDINIRFEEVVDDREESGFRYSTKESINLRARMISGLRRAADKYLSVLQAEDDIFIINSYLPRTDALRLHANLRQFPRFPSTNQVVIEMDPNNLLRGELGGRFVAKESGNLEHMVRALLFEMLPVCYLESFSLIKKKCMHLPWPRKPRTIFTSNNFDTDEIFKSWVADKVMQGSKYIIGQHGNNYGTHRHHFNPSIEEVTADQFLTWGWTDGLRQHRPAFLLKKAGRKNDAAIKSAGELLLIEYGLPHLLNTWDVHAEYNDYFKDQKCFVSKLAEPCYKQIRVRLSRAHEQMGWRS